MAKGTKDVDNQESEQEKEVIDFKREERNASAVVDTVGESREVDVVKKVGELFNKEIIVHGFKTLNGDHGEYFFCYAFFPGTEAEFGFITGSGVIMEKLSKIKEKGNLPVKCTLVDVGGKYHDIK